MIVHNLDTSDDLTNGVSGKMVHFTLSPSGTCIIIWVTFNDAYIGLQLKSKLKHLYVQGIQKIMDSN